MKKVCMVVQNPETKGGIAAVVNGYRGSKIERRYKIIYIESYKDGNKIDKLFKGLKGYLLFIKTLLFDNPDIVHIHSSFGMSFYRKIPYIYMASWRKKPVINHIHGAEFDNFFERSGNVKKKLIKKVYDKCSILIALSDEWKGCFSKIVSEEKIRVMENYGRICEDALEQRKKRKSNNTILFMGEIGKRKGCYDIPEVVKLVIRIVPRAKFILCGSGNHEDEIKKLFDKNEIGDHIIFTGWVREKEKDTMLRNADIFFLPSYNEGMPMSILDAMGYGLPIVSTNVGGIPKIVQNKKNGFCFDPGDVRAFADAICDLLSDDKYRLTTGENSIKIIKDRYSLEHHLDQLDELYRSIL